jgi:hypothetical protein
MRICIQISTGKLIEMQSLATPGTLTANALASGIPAEDIDEHEGTDEELNALLASDLPVPTITKAQALLWLWRNKGKTEDHVDAAIAAIPDLNERTEALIVWRYRAPWKVDHPLFALLAPAFDIVDLKAAFVEASQL